MQCSTVDISLSVPERKDTAPYYTFPRAVPARPKSAIKAQF